MTKKTIKLPKGWVVNLVVDDDNHLSIYAKNEDATEVIDTDMDITEDTEFGVRVTTKKIEEIFKEKLKGNKDFLEELKELEKTAKKNAEVMKQANKSLKKSSRKS